MHTNTLVEGHDIESLDDVIIKDGIAYLTLCQNHFVDQCVDVPDYSCLVEMRSCEGRV